MEYTILTTAKLGRGINGVDEFKITNITSPSTKEELFELIQENKFVKVKGKVNGETYDKYISSLYHGIKEFILNTNEIVAIF